MPQESSTGHASSAVDRSSQIHRVLDGTDVDDARALLAAIVESSDDAIISKTLDGVILTWNSGAERLFGWRPVEAIGRSIELIVPADRRDEEHQILQRLRRGERIDHYNTVRVTKTGRLLDVSLCISPIRDSKTGRIIGASKVARDISDTKLSELEQAALKNELAEQLLDLQRLQEMSVRLFATRDLQPILEEVLRTAMTIVDTDMGMLALCDTDSGTLTPRVCMGIDPSIVCEVEARPTGGASGLCHRLGQRIVIEDVEIDGRVADFRALALQTGIRAIHSTPLITRAGVIAGVLSTYSRTARRPSPREMHLTDLCARQAVDFIENARLYEQLMNADRAKNEFLAVLAHELRNPLAPIRNATRILRMAPPRSDPSNRSLEVIDRQMALMTRLVNDLLDLARITGDKLELRREPVEVSEIMRVAVESSGPAIEERSQDLIVENPSSKMRVHGDVTRLAQAVSNLLDNASKFTPPGGKIWLSARREGGEAVIAVRDTGAGIAAEALPSIFEMFTQAGQPANGGTGGLGIGLTLVQRFVALHGGRVTVTSDGPGKGSQFELRMPVFVSAAGLEPPAEESEAEPSVSASTRRVLVVEDNRDSASTMKMLLTLMGHHVMTAHDGLAGFAAAEEFRPDAVLLDIGIPLLNGHEVARRIREQVWGRRMLLIATTGWSSQQDLQLSERAGFDHHLVKPVDPDVLRQLIQGVSAGRPTAAESEASAKGA